ncbi:MAG: sigma-E factor negative regulatory protein [Burkholderiales bacterium]|nr:sigma-E factor negative regulatory protein [Burkholderiales bacterium]
MKQHLSEWVDGELDEAQARQLLSAVKSDPALRESWDAYHLIGDALRGQAGRGIAQRLAQRLAREATVLAPQRRSPARAGRLRNWSLSAAAALAAVTLIAWLAAPMAPIEPQVASAPVRSGAPAPSPLAVASGPQARSAHAEVEGYLLAHQRYSSMGAMQGVAPYLRAVSDEPRGDR